MKAFAPGTILLAMLLAACQPAADTPSPATAPAEPAATGAEPGSADLAARLDRVLARL